MPANTAPIFTIVPHIEAQQIVPADTTTKKTLFTPGANGSRIDAIKCSSNDTAAVVLNFYLTISAVDYFIGSVSVATLLGYSGALSADAVSQIGEVSLGALVLPSTAVLKVAANATVTAAKVVDVVAIGGDY